MSYFSSVKPIQDWLEDTKLTVSEPPEEAIETVMSGRVLGVLAQRYNTTAWVNDATSPALVTRIIGMLYAAAFYRRQYSEDLQDNPAWPVWLETTANDILTAIVTGVIDLIDVVEVVTGGQPVFFPTDASTAADPLDVNYSPRIFSMGTVF